ncbi:MAG: histidine kinase dimerization/phospho-acceptor domain-containing protein, partial [Eisenbergiella sp.]
QENDIIFSSDSRFIVPLPADEYGETIKDTSEASGVFNVTFTDGAVQAALVYTGYENYQSAGVIVTLLSGLCFAVILYLLIRKKVKYIELLGKELEILKGGDLNYQITIRGNDELAALAGEMDSMRRAIRSRQEEEELAHLANRGIVTAMSHDLRTPLTALMGYLDILSIEEDPGKKQKYLSVCRDKACQIKSLSDKLFEIFWYTAVTR